LQRQSTPGSLRCLSLWIHSEIGMVKIVTSEIASQRINANKLTFGKQTLLDQLLCKNRMADLTAMEPLTHIHELEIDGKQTRASMSFCFTCARKQLEVTEFLELRKSCRAASPMTLKSNQYQILCKYAEVHLWELRSLSSNTFFIT
jgi:hypothetical protein